MCMEIAANFLPTLENGALVVLYVELPHLHLEGSTQSFVKQIRGICIHSLKIHINVLSSVLGTFVLITIFFFLE